MAKIAMLPSRVQVAPGRVKAAPGFHATRDRGANWQRLRREVLMRDGGLCRCRDCRTTGRVRVASEVDHIVPRHQGGGDELSNLQAIHAECHRAKTRRELARR